MALQDWTKKYGLAICCVIAPLIFGYWAPNYIANKLMPLDKTKAPFSYLFPDTDSGSPSASDRKTRQANANAKAVAEAARLDAARAAAKKLETGEDPAKLNAARDEVTRLEQAMEASEVARVNQQSQYIVETLSGRYGYVAASGFLYVVAAAILLVGGTIIVKQEQWYFFFGGLVVFAIVAGLITVSPTAYEISGRLLLDQLFDKADESGVLDSLQAAQSENFRISAAIKSLVWANTFLGLLPVGVALLAFGVLSVRMKEPIQKESLETRLKSIRTLLVLCSVILVVATFASKVLLDWPLKLVADSQAKVLQPLAAALTAHLGITGTIALFAAVAPAVVSYSIDLERFGIGKPKTDLQGLEFASSSMITGVIAILAPALSSPLFSGFQAATAFLRPG